jgi:hypothetical protein
MAGDGLGVQRSKALSSAALAGAAAQAAGGAKEVKAAEPEGQAGPSPKTSARPEGETRYTEAKAGAPKVHGTGLGKVKQRSAADLKARKARPSRAKASFGGATATAEARAASAQAVSERLAAIPSQRRGAEAAELLAHGPLNTGQIAAYVAGAEGNNKTVQTALGRAAALLGSSDDPALERAVAQGLDSLVPSALSRPGEPSGAEKDTARRLEGQLKSFLENERLSPEAKRRVLEAVGDHSKSPALRSAAAVALSQHTAALKDHIEQGKRDLKASYDPHNLQNIPGGPSKVTEFRIGLEGQIHESEKSLASEQGALGKMLGGPTDWQADPKADPNQPQTSAGQLANYLERFHTDEQLDRAKQVVQALFDPPSAAAADGFAKMTERVKTANNLNDGDGLGYLVEAGHQAFAVEPAKERREAIQNAASVAQIALAAGLGYAGVVAAGALGISERAADQALRAGFSRMGQESFNSLLDAAKRSAPDEQKRWTQIKESVSLRLQGSVFSKTGFETGSGRARSRGEG